MESNGMLMKTGLVLEGGALRGIFTSGVLDCMMKYNIEFPYVVGVSAGGGNASNFVSRQIGRTKKVLTHEGTKPYFGLGRLFENRQVLDLDRMVVEFAMNDFPFDFETYFNSETECEYVLLDCESGKPVYVNKNTDRDHMLKYNMATCALPFACEPIEIDGHFYLDGSVADSIPAERAISQGCDKLVIVMTKPEGGAPTDYAKLKSLIDIYYQKKYPNLCDALMNRKTAYEKQMKYVKKLEKEGKVFIVRPEEKTIGHYVSNYDKLCECYDRGYHVMERRMNELKEFLGNEG